MLVKATFKFSIKCMQGTINKFIYLRDSCMSPSFLPPLVLSCEHQQHALNSIKNLCAPLEAAYMQLPLLFIGKNLIKH